MALDAVIFDMDGTLLNTNELHARAWKQTLNEFGYNVGQSRVAIEIGKGGDRLVPSVLGEEIAEEESKKMRDRHGEVYRDLVEHEGVAVFPKIRELFDAIHRRGLKIAVATASKKENLEHVIKKSGLDLLDLADDVVTDTDVENSKPAPDVVLAAVNKLKVSPAQCVMVGDTPYDVQACLQAGVVCIGVLTGVHTAWSMRRAGARLVYQHTEDLLVHLDEALDRASPGQAHLTPSFMDGLMEAALSEARKGMAEEEVPIGAVVATGDGSILACGHNEVRQRRTPVAHAEIVALECLPDLPEHRRRGLILATTVEPCVMCYGAALEVGIDTILYALPAPSNGGPSRCEPIQAPGAVVPRVVGDICRNDSRSLLEEWIQEHPDDAFVRDLFS